jgi:hypothetical protein
MWATVWTDEERAELTALCGLPEALSAAQMAERLTLRFERVFSRNAVTRQVRRLKLKLPLESSRANAHRRTGRTPIDAPMAVPGDGWRDRVEETPLPRFYERQSLFEDEGGPGIVLLNAGEMDCHWPIGEAIGWRQRACGEPTTGEGPYCPKCTRLAYNEAPQGSMLDLLKSSPFLFG